MIYRARDQRSEERSEMRGGNGTIALTHLIEGADSFGKSRLAARLRLPPGASIGPHTHQPDAELYIICEGEATVTDNGTPHVLRAGDTMFTGNGDSHSIENTGADDLVIYAIIFN